MEQLAEIIRTNKAPEQQNPSPPTEHVTDSPSAAPTEQTIAPAPTEHVAPRVP